MENGIPRTEKIWVKRVAQSGEVYYITSKESREVYYLYRLKDKKAERIGKSKNPLELEEGYID